MILAVARIALPSAKARIAKAKRAGSCSKSKYGVPYVKATLLRHARHSAWRWPRVVPFFTKRLSRKPTLYNAQAGFGQYNVSSLPILEKGEQFPRVICILAL